MAYSIYKKWKQSVDCKIYSVESSQLQPNITLPPQKKEKKRKDKDKDYIHKFINYN